MGVIKSGATGAVCVGMLGAGLYLADKFDLLPFQPPACVRDFNLDNCTPDGLASILHLGNTGLSNIGHETVYTSNVGGGTVKIRTTEERWPLFDRLVKLDPFEVKKDGNDAYSARSMNRVSSEMIGRITALTFKENGVNETYVVAVDDKGTADKTDDQLVPINVNNFDMVSSSDLPVFTYPAETQEADYNTCVESLINDDPKVGGCILSGVDGHNTAIDATITNNLYQQYLGADQDVIDTLKIASNAVLANKGPSEWNTENAETVRSAQLDIESIKRRMGPATNTDIDHVHVIATDELVAGVYKPNEYASGHSVDLTQVEKLSDGKYKAADVRVETFGANQGSWNTNESGADAVPGLKKIMGDQILDKNWLEQWTYTHEDMPAKISSMVSNAKGVFTDPATISPPSTNQG